MKPLRSFLRAACVCLLAFSALPLHSQRPPAAKSREASRQGKSATGLAFTDIALAAGFQDRLSHGRAIAVADFNGDGLPDIYLGNPGYPQYLDDQSVILLNNGLDSQGNISFTRGQVVLQGEIAFTATAFDYDNDGDPDLFVGVGGQENIGLDHLFRNDGGTLVDVSEQAQIRGPKDSSGNWVPAATSAGAVLDYDKDGCLDLFVASRTQTYSLILPGNLGWRDSLFHNNCDGSGTFTDVTVAAGLNDTGSTMTPAIGDFDNDGWPDIFVCYWNGTGGLGFQFYRNNHDDTFQKIVMDANALDYGTQAGFSSGVADFNNDGLLDVMVWGRGQDPLNPDSHALFINHGNWVFTNEAKSSGIVGPTIPVPLLMGNQIGDIDNDGYPDLLIGNGRPESGAKDNLWLNLFATTGTLQFEDQSDLIDSPALPDPTCVPPGFDRNFLDPTVSMTGMEVKSSSTGDDCGVNDLSTRFMSPGVDLCNPPYPYRGHAIALWDFDGDGDLDIFMSKGGTANLSTSVEPKRLFRNDSSNGNNWLAVNLQGTVSNRDATGSRVQVIAHHQGSIRRSIYLDQLGISNFESSGPHEFHFGLGKDDTVDSVLVKWPSGIQSLLRGVAINQKLTVAENTILTSTFNDGTASGWVPRSGSWAVVNHAYQQSNASGGMSFNGNISVPDYTVVAKLTYNSGSGGMLLLGRSSTDGKNNYGVLLQGSKARLFKTIAGVRTYLGSPVAISPATPGMSYMVRLAMIGTTIQAQIDGASILPVTDTSLSSGAIGLSAAGVIATFDNVAVY